jgi:hypothetical protein
MTGCEFRATLKEQADSCFLYETVHGEQNYPPFLKSTALPILLRRQSAEKEAKHQRNTGDQPEQLSCSSQYPCLERMVFHVGFWAESCGRHGAEHMHAKPRAILALDPR